MSQFEKYLAEGRGISHSSASVFMLGLKNFPKTAAEEPKLTKSVARGLLKLAMIARTAASEDAAKQQAADAAMTDPNVQEALDYQQSKAEADDLRMQVEQLQQQSEAAQQQAAQADQQAMAAQQQAVQAQQQVIDEQQGRQQAQMQAMQATDAAIASQAANQQQRIALANEAEQFALRLKSLIGTDPQAQMQTQAASQAAQGSMAPTPQEEQAAVQEQQMAAQQTGAPPQQAAQPKPPAQKKPAEQQKTPSGGAQQPKAPSAPKPTGQNKQSSHAFNKIMMRLQKEAFSVQVPRRGAWRKGVEWLGGLGMGEEKRRLAQLQARAREAGRSYANPSRSTAQSTLKKKHFPVIKEHTRTRKEFREKAHEIGKRRLPWLGIGAAAPIAIGGAEALRKHGASLKGVAAVTAGGAALGGLIGAAKGEHKRKGLQLGQPTERERKLYEKLRERSQDVQKQPSYVNKLRAANAQHRYNIERAGREHPSGETARGTMRGAMYGALAAPGVLYGGRKALKILKLRKALKAGAAAAEKAAK